MSTGTYKAFLIDPFAKTVTEVVVDRARSYHAINKLIEADAFQEAPNDLMEGPQIPVVLCDEEGLFKDYQAWFLYAARSEPVCGKALAVGDDGSEEYDSVSLTLAEFTSMIRWGVPAKVMGELVWVDDA